VQTYSRRGAPHGDADLLEVRVEAPLRGHHGVAAAMPERGAFSTRVTDLRHGGSSGGQRVATYREPRIRLVTDVVGNYT
jgi:hypothetical protein